MEITNRNYSDGKMTPHHVAAIPFFQDLDRKYLEILVGVLKIQKFKNNECVFVEGEEPLRMFFLIEGSVKVLKRTYKGFEEQLAEIYAPQIFGEMAFIDKGRRSASVIALSDIVAAELSLKDFEGFITSHPELAVYILKKIAFTLSLRLRKSNSSNIRLSH